MRWFIIIEHAENWLYTIFLLPLTLATNFLSSLIRSTEHSRPTFASLIEFRFHFVDFRNDFRFPFLRRSKVNTFCATVFSADCICIGLRSCFPRPTLTLELPELSLNIFHRLCNVHICCRSRFHWHWLTMSCLSFYSLSFINNAYMRLFPLPLSHLELPELLLDVSHGVGQFGDRLVKVAWSAQQPILSRIPAWPGGKMVLACVCVCLSARVCV